LTILQSGSSFVFALIAFLPLSPAIASAQDKPAPPIEQQAETRPRRVTQQPAVTPEPLQQPVEQPVVEGVVVPDAPKIIKRSPNSIAIPIDAAEIAAYEEREIAASGVKVGSRFGYRRDPFTRRSKFHSGLDIKARWGDPVGASHPGVVQFAGWYYGYGNMIIIDHGGGVATHYAHLSSFAVDVGDKVERATVIGYAGSTGRATSPHLHYEVRIDGEAVDPLRPVALDPSSAFFNPSRLHVDAASRDEVAPAPPVKQ